MGACFCNGVGVKRVSGSSAPDLLYCLDGERDEWADRQDGIGPKDVQIALTFLNGERVDLQMHSDRRIWDLMERIWEIQQQIPSTCQKIIFGHKRC